MLGQPQQEESSCGLASWQMGGCSTLLLVLLLKHAPISPFPTLLEVADVLSKHNLTYQAMVDKSEL